MGIHLLFEFYEPHVEGFRAGSAFDLLCKGECLKMEAVDESRVPKIREAFVEVYWPISLDVEFIDTEEFAYVGTK